MRPMWIRLDFYKYGQTADVSCSYGDKMRVGIISKIPPDHNISEFLRILKRERIHVTEQEVFPRISGKKLGLCEEYTRFLRFCVLLRL